MENLKYKEYTEEENLIYDESISKIKEGLKNGLSFNEACNIVNIEDAELKRLILDDALKIMIADMHYTKGMTLRQVADTLRVPIIIVDRANNEMLEDVGISAAELYKMSNPNNPIGNA